MIAVSRVNLGYTGRPILSDVDLQFGPGTINALVGANGSGKSTLLRSLAGLHRPASGQATLEGIPMSHWSRREIARRIAYLAQSPEAPEGLTVAQLVEHGGFARRSLVGRVDPAAVLKALASVRLADFADRPFASLSGGERQRAWIAMALMQDAGMLLLDESTSFLDIGHQIEILRLLQALRDERGLGVVMVLHDINQASRFCDRIVVLHQGRVLRDGTPQSVLNAELVETVFGAKVKILPEGDGRHPYCVPVW